MEAPGGGVDVARLESLASGGEKEKQDALAAGEKVGTAIHCLGSTLKGPLWWSDIVLQGWMEKGVGAGRGRVV